MMVMAILGALTDGLEGETLIAGVVESNTTRKTGAEIEAHVETLMPLL
jgi:hypothetical protein